MINRLWNNLKRKIFLIVARGILTEIDNSVSETQKIQVKLLDGETITGIDRFQEYGFENYPFLVNGESIILFVNGNRNAEKGLSIVSNNRKYRPTDLEEGDVCIYRKDSNDTNANRIWLKKTDNTIHISTYDKKEIIIDTNKIEIKDNDGNDSIWDTNGIKHTDKNNNVFEMTNTGTKLTDKNNMTIETTATKVAINGTNLEILL